MVEVSIKRVYAPYDSKDKKRILIDRLWPRGLSKDKAHIDLWLKDVAPSTELRKWFGHDPAKWLEFQKRYKQELDSNTTAINELKRQLEDGPVTLVYGAKDEEHNDAVVLKGYLEE